MHLLPTKSGDAVLLMQLFHCCFEAYTLTLCVLFTAKQFTIAVKLAKECKEVCKEVPVA